MPGTQQTRTEQSPAPSNVDEHEDADASSRPVATFMDVTASDDGGVKFEEINLEFQRGAITALLGTGGSGRTLLLNLLLGLATPSAGEIRILGNAPDDVETRRRVGGAPYHTSFPGMLKVREIVEFVAAHYTTSTSIDDFLDHSGLKPYAAKKISDLSRSEERWIAVMLAFVGEPDFVVLDHPTRGMDVQWRVELWKRLRDFVKQGGSVAISTGVSDQVQAAADQVAVFYNGSIIATGSPNEIIESVGEQYIALPHEGLEKIDVSRRITLESGRAAIPTSDTETTVQELIDHGVPREQLETSRTNLEHAILQLIREAQE